VTDQLTGTSAILADLAPLLRRAVRDDPGSIARVRISRGTASALVRLPFGVLVGRTIGAEWSGAVVDSAVGCAELLDWLDGATATEPASRAAQWRVGLPPTSGWHRVDSVPDDVVRGLVRSGARTLAEVAEREGVPGAQPRAEVADVLLDSVVLTATEGPLRAEITLRVLSAMTRMGFLPRDSQIAIDVAGRWLRVAARYGSVYAEQRSSGLTVLR